MYKFYGKWKINEKKSESINDLLKFFDIPFMYRKMAGNDNTIIIKSSGKGISIKDINKFSEMEKHHNFEEKYIKSINNEGKPVKTKSIYKNNIITIMTLNNNNIMLIRQLDVRGTSLRDRIYYKKYGNKEFQSVTRFYNKVSNK
jgi:hypothetical protein